MANVGQGARQKKLELVYQVIRRSDGISEKEIAEELNMERRTVNNYLWELEAEGKIYKEDFSTLWLALPYQKVRLRPFELSPEEAMTLYLAVRLLVKQHDKRNDAAQLALTKLAEVLTGDAGVGNEVYQAALELARRPDNENYGRIFRTIMQGYIYRRKIIITYKPLDEKPFETIFSPYLIEPSAIGYATYVIGHSSIVDDQRTYKLQRISRAALTREEYTIPADFPGLEILRDAWSIITGDKLIEVVLRFSPRVKERLLESQWHPSQQPVEDDPEKPGWSIWRAKVADLTDLIPWVRSWGADVEVREPARLRRRIESEVRQMARMYGQVVQAQYQQQDDPLLPFESPARRLWAKTNREGDQDEETHPLICHLIDVAQVACALWDLGLPFATRRFFASSLNMDEATARLWLAFLAGLHDLGKASPTFQGLYLPGKAALREVGFDFPDSAKAPHGLVSAWALKRLFAGYTGLAGEARHNLAVAIGGHHGIWPTPKEVNLGLGPGQYGEGLWEETRTVLFLTLAQVLGLAELKRFELTEDEEGSNVFCMALAGFISVADWLGSMTEFFSFVPAQINLADYAQEAYQQAAKALLQLGWSGWSPPAHPLAFSQLFPFQARPLQQAVVELAEVAQLAPPALVIIEAPTGEGKTEAAWYLADAWLARHQQRGVYVAMPTQATSNQMLRRVWEFIERRYPGQRTNLILLHGDAAWSEDMRQLRLAAINEDELGTVAAQAWFLPKKRSLLAPFAVGTVDQALLATMQTRHFFVRMFGLSHKTVIFDEIHAYDIYMNVLFQRLLRWLAAMGASVILLSATLPARTRRQLVEAYTGRPFEQEVQYPALTWAAREPTAEGEVTSSLQGVVSLSAALPRTVSLSWLEFETMIEYLREALQQGGCIAVICNTVRRAQAIYRLLAEAGLVAPEELLLFHAQFPFYLRRQIEAEVLERFGKGEQRPARSIVVATQVIEQSLDLDFDLMISELAPVDLILQRIGRLHRRQRPERPGPLAKPQLWLIRPGLQDEVPQLEVDARIYAPYVLLRSYLALRGRTSITIPEEVQPLIEAVYGPDEDGREALPAAWQQALAEAKTKLDEEVFKQENAARQNLIYPPDHEDLLRQASRELEEDKPEMHTALQALTRLTRPTVTLICLHQTPGGLALDPEGGKLISLEDKPDWDTARQLVERKVTLSNYEVVSHFARLEPPPAWQKEPNLRHYRPLIFTAGRRLVSGNLSLIFDLKQGIIIQKEIL